jgi:hypothetical protein
VKKGVTIVAQKKKKRIQKPMLQKPKQPTTATNVRSEKRIVIPKQNCRCLPPKPSFQEEKWYGNYIASLAYFLATVVFFCRALFLCILCVNHTFTSLFFGIEKE